MVTDVNVNVCFRILLSNSNDAHDEKMCLLDYYLRRCLYLWKYDTS